MRFLFLLLFSFNLYAAGQFEVTSHREVLSFLEKNELISPDTLIVFDIDNTLLKSHHSFGSDQWFNWQLEEIRTQNLARIVKTVDELIKIQNQIFHLGKMDLTENDVPLIIKELTQKRVKMIALTSRGPEMSLPTFRELSQNGISFNETKIGHDMSNEFIPHNGNANAIYKNGVFMTSGMHKGQMLSYILGQFNSHFKHIIFIDDHKKHTDRVFETLSAKGIDITTFRYGHEDEAVERYHRSSKGDSVYLGAQLKRLINLLNE